MMMANRENRVGMRRSQSTTRAHTALIHTPAIAYAHTGRHSQDSELVVVPNGLNKCIPTGATKPALFKLMLTRHFGFLTG